LKKLFKEFRMSEISESRTLSRRQILSDIIGLAWPAIVEQILIMMGGFTITIFLGRYGTNELAAAGLVGMIMGLLQTAFAGMATGSTVIIARLTGMGEEREARNTLFQSLVMGLSIALIITAAGFLWSRQIIAFFFANVIEVQNMANIYFKYVLFSLPFLTLDITIAAAVRGAGDMLSPMVITGLASAFNIVLCLPLIDKLGVAGAGLSLLLTRVLAALLRLVLIFFRKQKIYLSLKEPYRLDIPLMRRIMRQGLPCFFEQVFMQGGFLASNTILAYLGTVILATWQVGVNVNSLAIMPVFGLAIATTTSIGQALGAGRYAEAGDYARESLRAGIIVICAMGLMVGLFAGPLARLFSTDPEVIRNSIMLLRFFAVAEVTLGIMNICASVLRAGGDIVYIMLTALVGLWLFRVGLSALLVYRFNMGFYGIMIGTGADYIIRSALYGFRVRRGRWKYIKV
jgi:putative MATE family efflux protein